MTPQLNHPDSTFIGDWLDEWKAAIDKDPEIIHDDTTMQWWIVQLFMHGYDAGFDAAKKTSSRSKIVNAYEDNDQRLAQQ